MTIDELGLALRRRREAAGLTQAQLAVAAGVSPKWVYQVENGRVPNFRVATLNKVADQLEVVVGFQMTEKPA